MIQPTRKLAVIMFTDIAEFTALSARDEDAALQLLQHQRAVLRPIVTKHEGTWLREVGDGLLLTFPLVSSAVRCAIEMQQATQHIPELRLRIGIHEGEITEYGGEVLGDDVNVAARIEAFAAPGGVAISGKVQQDISSLPEFATRYLGQPRLKGVRQEVKVYCVTSHGLPVTDVTTVAAKLEPGERMGAGPVWRRPIGIATIAVLSLVLGLVSAWLLKPIPEPLLRKFQFSKALININQPKSFDFSKISPDGTMVAYTSQRRLWIQDLNQLEPREIPDTEGAIDPFWSPESDFVGYSTGGVLKKVNIRGGFSSLLCTVPAVGGDWMHGTWNQNGRIVFSVLGNLYEISDQGREPQVILKPDSTQGDIGFHNVAYLPDGQSLVFRVQKKDGPDEIVLYSGMTRTRIVAGTKEERFIGYPVYSPSGHILYQKGYVVGTGIWAIPFSLSSLTVSGEPFPVVRQGTWPSVSSDGTLVYTTVPTAAGARSSAKRQLVWVDRSGRVEGTIGQGMAWPALSPDGRRVAVVANEQGNEDIWVHDIERGTAPRRLTFDPAPDGFPAWSPNSDAVVFLSRRSGKWDIFMKRADGTGPLDTLVSDLDEDWWPDWSRDGRYLVYTRSFQEGDLWYLRMTGDRTPVRFMETPQHREGYATLSPNGRYVAYDSDESGRREVYVRSFPSGEGPWQISVNGGNSPRWNGDGTELFYVEGEDEWASVPRGTTLMAAPVQTQLVFQYGTPQALFSTLAIGAIGNKNYDVSADGQRFLVMQDVEEGETPTITVVQNWVRAFVKKP